MTVLSPTMQRAIALAREQGELHRRPGGFWTVPDEPMMSGTRGPIESERYVGTQTVRALQRRGILTTPDNRPWWVVVVEEES